MKKPIVLMILDGFSLVKEDRGNAVNAAKKPNIDRYFKENPHCYLKTSGLSVGLPDGQMGNSEVGHTNIGAGRVVFQDLPRITNSIEDGTFKTHFDISKSQKIHIFGLLSDGGVHSHINHIKALVEMAKSQGKQVFLHAFLDGRDTPPTSGKEFVREMSSMVDIATISGRFYAMDRDKRWERIEEAYQNILGNGKNEYFDPVQAVEDSYKNNITDEFVVPCYKKGYSGVKNGDTIIFANFRPDRAREITRKFVEGNDVKLAKYICMTEYDATIPNVDIAFKHEEITDTLGEVIADAGLSQLRIAETEKYAHVTFFFNGGREETFKNEDRILVPSPKVATYDLKPEMSANEVTDKLLEALSTNKYDLVILNYANCDMVGHTGIFEAAKKAVEAVDICVGKIVSKVEEMGGVVYITADHGNSEKMLADDGTPYTAHTTNDVPFIAVGVNKSLHNGALCDISPTILSEMGLNQPKQMTGNTLYD